MGCDQDCAPPSQIASFDLQHTVDRHEELILGDLALNLRQRLRCIFAAQPLLPPDHPGIPTDLQPAVVKVSPGTRLLQTLMFGEEGLVVDVRGVLVDIPHQIQLGPMAEAALLHFAALAKHISDMPGKWHAGDARHYTHFSRFAPTGFDLRDVHEPEGKGDETPVGSTPVNVHRRRKSWSSTSLLPLLPHVWLKCSHIAVSIDDDPWESWLSKASRGLCVCVLCLVCVRKGALGVPSLYLFCRGGLQTSSSWPKFLTNTVVFKECLDQYTDLHNSTSSSTATVRSLEDGIQCYGALMCFLCCFCDSPCSLPRSVPLPICACSHVLAAPAHRAPS